MSRDDWVVIASYLLGGCVLSVFGPDLWGLPTIFAAAAAFGASATFCLAHIAWRTVKNFLARRQLRIAALAGHDLPTIDSDDSELPANDEAAAGDPAKVPAPEAVNLDLSLQPIVSLKDGKPRHYMARADVCMAVRDDGLADTFSDTLKIAEVIALAGHLGDSNPEARIFCGIAPGTLGDDAFRSDLVEVMSKVPELSERLVFEVDAEMAALTSPAAMDLAALAKLGFTLCVRLNLADQVRENFVGTLRKLPAHEMLALTEGAVLAQRRCGMTLIATGIADEDMVVGLAQLGVSLGEGEIFGAARTIKRPSLTKLAA